MARPKIGHIRKVVIEFDVLDDLKVVAAMQGVPVSHVIRDGLRFYTEHVLKKRKRRSA